MHDVGEVRARQRDAVRRIFGDPRDPEIGHLILPPLTAFPRRFDYAFVTDFRTVGTSPMTPARLTTAWRNTSRPFILNLPTVPVVEGPPSTNSKSLCRPSA